MSSRVAVTGFAIALGAGVLVGQLQGDARAASEHKMGMMGVAYTPKLLRVKVGDTINFLNDDLIDHWVYVPTFGHQISRANQKPGESFKFVAGKPGTFDVECALHVDMSARVIVSR
jgi:plastocyanin